MEVLVLPPMADDFHFTTTSSYTSAPSSPRPFGGAPAFYASAPASPSRRSASERFDSFLFDQDEDQDKDHEEPFEFAFGLGPRPLASADELFEDGRIKTAVRPINFDTVAGERGRSMHSVPPNNPRRSSRSLSPRGEPLDRRIELTKECNESTSKKWKLRDLFLFRSASEGRATGRRSKDPLMKYTMVSSPSSSSPSKSSSVFLRPFQRKEKKNGDAQSSTLKRGSATTKKTPLAYHENSMFSLLSFNGPAAGGVQYRRSSFSRN